jgi:hypothetical protein
MSDATRKLSGGCHCGSVRYEVTADPSQAIACNCSICSKKAYLLTFVSADQFKLLTPEYALTDYQFNKHNVHHLFCSTCGIQSFGRGTAPDGRAIVAINVRCLDGVEVSSVTVTNVDGKSL